jgi:hypothetical protein
MCQLCEDYPDDETYSEPQPDGTTRGACAKCAAELGLIPRHAALHDCRSCGGDAHPDDRPWKTDNLCWDCQRADEEAPGEDTDEHRDTDKHATAFEVECAQGIFSRDVSVEDGAPAERTKEGVWIEARVFLSHALLRELAKCAPSKTDPILAANGPLKSGG